MLMVAADNTKSPQERTDAFLRAKALDHQPEPKIGSVALQMAKTGRSEQAHAFQDALRVRKERSLLEKAWQGWQELRTEAFALAKQVKGLFPSRQASIGATPKEATPKTDPLAVLRTAWERLNAEIQRDRANSLFAQMHAVQDAYFVAKKQGEPVPLQTYKAQQETLLAKIQALGLEDLQPKIESVSKQLSVQLQKEAERRDRPIPQRNAEREAEPKQTQTPPKEKQRSHKQRM